MDCDVETFENDIELALSGNAIVNRLPLQATSETTSGNKIKSDPAMNDLLVANAVSMRHQDTTLDEKLDIKQQSSGLLLTWLGQGAWFNHIVRDSNLGSAEDSDTHYLVTEDIDSKITDEDTWHGQVSPQP